MTAVVEQQAPVPVPEEWRLQLGGLLRGHPGLRSSLRITTGDWTTVAAPVFVVAVGAAAAVSRSSPGVAIAAMATGAITRIFIVVLLHVERPTGRGIAPS